MAKRLSDLTVLTSGAHVDVLRVGNDAFLRGDRPEAVLDTLWDGWKIIGRMLLAVGAMLMAAVVAVLAYIAVWNSPLTVHTTGVIDSGQSGRVMYHYQVDSLRFDKTESVNRSDSAWDAGNVPHPVVYLGFMPSESRLDFNVETLDWGAAFFMILFASFVPLGGWLLLRSNRRMNVLRDEATHVLEGRITQDIAGPHGSKNYVYKAASPVTGKPIRGTLQVGRIGPRAGRIGGIGSTVAILYQSDSLHSAL